MRRSSIGMMAAAVAAMGAVSGIAVTDEPTQRVAQAPRRVRAPTPIPFTRTRPRVSLNRSKHWDYAETYAEARAISPFPHRPVR